MKNTDNRKWNEVVRRGGGGIQKVGVISTITDSTNTCEKTD